MYLYLYRKEIQSIQGDNDTPRACNSNRVGSQDMDDRRRNYFPTIPRGI